MLLEWSVAGLLLAAALWPLVRKTRSRGARAARAFSFCRYAARRFRLAILRDRTLVAASVLMPAVFFTGGIWVYAGDPGLGILLVPAGGLLLFAAVLLTALSLKHFQLDARRDGSSRRQISNRNK